MPRTELGPAICNCSRWNPADGHSPLTRHDRRDARFINSISKPPRKGKQAIGSATGIARSNLQPRESAFGSGTLPFDRGADVPAVCDGASCGGDVNAKSTAKFGSTSFEYLNRRARRVVNLVAATVANAPPNLCRLFAAAIMKSKLFRPQKIERNDGRVFIRHTILVRHNGRLLRHVWRG
jgi:hypothetical protein